MKARFVAACIIFLISSYSFGACGGDTGLTSCGGGGGSGSCSQDPYVNTCQCTDPACTRSYGHECLSQSECCEAFGNVGAR